MNHDAQLESAEESGMWPVLLLIAALFLALAFVPAPWWAVVIIWIQLVHVFLGGK